MNKYQPQSTPPGFKDLADPVTTPSRNRIGGLRDNNDPICPLAPSFDRFGADSALTRLSRETTLTRMSRPSQG